jgi:carbamoyltransferase
MTTIVGISALYHDAACCLIRDGRLVAAAQEERFSRMKYDPRAPVNAFAYCLDAAGLSVDDVTCVAYYENPAAKIDRIVCSFADGIGNIGWLLDSWEEKTDTLNFLAGKLDYAGEMRSFDHHLSHGASAYYASGFENAAILTADGVGEWTTTSLAKGIDGKVQIFDTVDFPHSLGLFYSAITSFLGFQPNSDEYKVMGLAAFGRPSYYRARLQKALLDDGRNAFRLDMAYFDYNQRMYSAALADLLGIAPRKPGEAIRQQHKDIAASAQELLEKALIAIAERLHDATGLTDLCMAGGVALNCVANARLERETPFTRIFVQPASGDAGGALGAAMLAYQEITGSRPDPMTHAYLGPRYSTAEVRRYLSRIGARFEEFAVEDLVKRVAAELEAAKVVGWFQGAMEFGPRALGARSILADARRADMQDILNLKIKQRESFRPFAPICLREAANDYFECPGELPFMTFTVKVRDPRVLPAISHVDGTARLQTVDSRTAPRLASLLRAFEERTGVPVLINTSFNRNGEPIVCSPEDAFSCFRESGIDILVMDNFLVDRAAQAEELVTPGSLPYFSLAREVAPYLRDTYFFT